MKVDMDEIKRWEQFGHPRAKIELGLHLAFSNDDHRLHVTPQIFRMWKYAADIGLVNGQFLTGLCYEHGIGVSRNLKVAGKWYIKAAWQDDCDAQYLLAMKHKSCEGEEREVFYPYWIYEAACNGRSHAQNEMANIYMVGIGNWGKDEKEAVKWYKKATKQAVYQACYNLASCYEKGLGVKTDDESAFRYLKKAARIKKKTRQHLILSLDDLIVEDDDRLWMIRETACNRITEPIAVSPKLAYYYENGIGIDKDVRKAERWLNEEL